MSRGLQAIVPTGATIPLAVLHGGHGSCIVRGILRYGGTIIEGKSARVAAAIAVAVAAIAGVIAVVASLWRAVGDAEISAAGWVAMVLGILVTLALGVGLMALVFISNRRGFDE